MDVAHPARFALTQGEIHKTIARVKIAHSIDSHHLSRPAPVRIFANIEWLTDEVTKEGAGIFRMEALVQHGVAEGVELLLQNLIVARLPNVFEDYIGVHHLNAQGENMKNRFSEERQVIMRDGHFGGGIRIAFEPKRNIGRDLFIGSATVGKDTLQILHLRWAVNGQPHVQHAAVSVEKPLDLGGTV